MSDLRLLRHAVPVAERRREWHGAGAPLPQSVNRILALARGGKQCKWNGLGRRVGRGHDQIDVEGLLWAAVDAGLVIVSERKDRRRDWEPYQWRLTEAGEVLVARKKEPIDIARYLAQEDDPNHPVLAAIRLWLERDTGRATITRLVIAIGDELRAGRVPRERLLVKEDRWLLQGNPDQRVSGRTGRRPRRAPRRVRA